MEFLNRQIGISVVSKLDTPNIHKKFETSFLLFSCQQHLIVGG